MKIFLKNPERFQLLMVENGLSKSSLARMIGVTPSYMNLIVNEKRHFSPQIAKKVADSLNMDFHDIFFVESVLKNEHSDNEVYQIGTGTV